MNVTRKSLGPCLEYVGAAEWVVLVFRTWGILPTSHNTAQNTLKVKLELNQWSETPQKSISPSVILVHLDFFLQLWAPHWAFSDHSEV